MVDFIVFDLKTVFSLLLGLVTYLICWFYWKNQKILSEARKLPTGRLALPLIGHGYLIFNGLVGMTNIMLETIQTAAAQSINTIVLWLGPYPIFVISDPEDVQIIYNSSKCLDVGFEHKLMRYALGDSISIASGNLWKIKRRHMKHMFHPRNVENFLPEINNLCRELNRSLLPEVGKGKFDVIEYLPTLTYKSTNLLIFGLDKKINFEDDVPKKVTKTVESIAEIAVLRVFKFWLWPEFIFQTLYKKKIIEIMSIGKTVFNQHIKQSKVKYMEMISDKNEETITTNGGNYSLLSLLDVNNALMNVVPGYTDEDTYREVITIYFAGMETINVTMSSCLMALAAKTQIQERLHAEIVSVAGSHEDLTVEDIKSMRYLDQVIKETLRKFLVVPFISRHVQETVKLSSCTLPAGSLALVAMFAVHHNPKYFPDPEKFDPDRFNANNSVQNNNNLFVAFGAGPRNCIGKDHAMLVMKTVIVHVIRKYKLSTTTDIDNITYVGTPVSKLVDGYKLTLELREYS